METALVSIITPSYNSEKFIADTIRSVQSQTYTNWELLIVDDCSTDGTKHIVKDFMEEDRRVTFHQLRKNSGAGVARNQAVEMAGGKYIAFLDSDDLWQPEKLEKQIAFMETNRLPFTFSFYDCIDEDGNPLHKRIEAPKTLRYSHLFFCNFVGNLTGIYDAEYFGKIPISGIRKRQDWMVWLTVLKRIRKGKPVPESLALYRVRKNSISSSKLTLLQHNFTVYRLFHKYSVLTSLVCMCGFLLVQLLVKPMYSKKITPANGTA
jgi:teichuronic acid biosynthesis glycosyltransferase TuaG